MDDKKLTLDEIIKEYTLDNDMEKAIISCGNMETINRLTEKMVRSGIVPEYKIRMAILGLDKKGVIRFLK